MANTVKIAVLITQLLVVVIYDLSTYKVKNAAIVIFMLFGIVFNISIVSINGIIPYILGMLAPFFLLLPLYMLNMLGAGDIKLFCSIGALIGIKGVLISIACSFASALPIALLIMIWRKNLIKRMKSLYLYLKNCLLTFNLCPYEELREDSDGSMHFTIPIAIGTIIASLF